MSETLTEKPGYYAIIPANIRYDKNLSANAKLMYGEITCLLNFRNKCFATNRYFSKLYELSEVQVSRIINQLIKAGYLKSETEITKTGSRRLLKVVININVNSTNSINDLGPIIKNDNHNNQSINNNHLSKDKRKSAKKDFVKPTLQNVKDYFEEKGFSSTAAKTAYDYYEVADWKDSSGKQVLNWKQKMISVWFKDANKIIVNSQERIKF